MRTLVLMMAALLPVGCSKAREQRQAAEDKRNTDEAKARLEKIGKAVWKHTDSAHFFPAGVVGTDNRVGLSWRVQILSLLGPEEYELYKQFNEKEPWDSAHNKTLIEKMPEVFASPGVAGEPGYTHVRAFVAAGGKVKAIMPWADEFKTPRFPGQPVSPPPPQRPGSWVRGRSIADIRDGTANTLFAVEAAEAVPWTKPDEFEYDPAKPLPKLGVLPGGFLGLTCVGGVHLFPDTLATETVRALITVNGGEVLPPDTHDLIWGEYERNKKTAPPVTK